MKCGNVNVRNALEFNLKKNIKEKTKLTDQEIAIIYKRFHSICSNGKLNYKQFEKSLGILGTIKNAYLYKCIFKAFDLNNDGYIDIYEFCVAINIMLKGNKRDKLKLSYRIIQSGSSVKLEEFKENVKSFNDDQNNYLEYITYDDFERIILSIKDIKKQLLGEEDEIVISHVKYTFRSLSILCDDGKYRMNLKCYKRAMKCHEFLKFIGIHTKVADTFIKNNELIIKKKKKKQKKYKIDSGKKVLNHLKKSYSESTSTRLSLLRGTTSLFIKKKKQKKKKNYEKKLANLYSFQGKDDHNENKINIFKDVIDNKNTNLITNIDVVNSNNNTFKKHDILLNSNKDNSYFNNISTKYNSISQNSQKRNDENGLFECALSDKDGKHILNQTEQIKLCGKVNKKCDNLGKCIETLENHIPQNSEDTPADIYPDLYKEHEIKDKKDVRNVDRKEKGATNLGIEKRDESKNYIYSSDEKKIDNDKSESLSKTQFLDLKSQIFDFEKKKENKKYIDTWNMYINKYKEYIKKIEEIEACETENENVNPSDKKLIESNDKSKVENNSVEKYYEQDNKSNDFDSIDSENNSSIYDKDVDVGSAASSISTYTKVSDKCNGDVIELIENKSDEYSYQESNKREGNSSGKYLFEKYIQYHNFVNETEDIKLFINDTHKNSQKLELSKDILYKKFYIPGSNSQYFVINNNLSTDELLYNIRKILINVEDCLKNDKDNKNENYDKIFFMFFYIFIYNNTNEETQKIESKQIYSQNKRIKKYKSVLLVVSIIRYFLHTITISQKYYCSSYDSIDEYNNLNNNKMVNNISNSNNEINVILNQTNEVLGKYAKGKFQNKKIYINKSNYYNSSKKRKLSVSIRHKKKKKNSKLFAVYFGHERWDLVMNMMIGIRICAIKEFNIDNILNYYRHTDVIQLSTSSANEKVLFKNYSPIIFKNIRKIFGIKSKEYITSVGPEQVISNMVLGNLSTLSELLSEGKSGSLFYFTSNGKYIIKTVNKGIHKLSKKLLPKYYKYIQKNPDSLLTRLYGIHSIKYQNGSSKTIKKIFFIVMNNFFSSAVEIHRRYDIKGSLIGRSVPIEKRGDHTIALKDVDIDELGDVINIGPEYKEKLLSILKSDANFLKENLLLDYSLLFGIHYKELSRDVVCWNKKKTNEVRHVYDEFGLCVVAKPFHQLDHGGMINIDKNRIFFFGIIDIFTKWNLKKKMEHTFRTIQKLDRKNISCIPPKAYAERFVAFIEKHME
ncbi:phosphatidylinositol-4-phosphate 5-kinase, putative [Plasmodium berghei]|uniref:non-specific serine/threonine protein kinase n=2 Tax=Plasmodium berghei TaxID=5821 RepID=A0A509AJF9_PLABA|nr:phosphatidylinositol-4-phosphate 5-kinase, putative [Plasmodium berghei ANKA]CXH85961.1 phosphatidylinositol-4-phosphate 5-kinase, putative [Plasmodium berghei]SCL89932.1 phosphatidylinositol-4-phosphate 5-kinase, putative [Plasmodium berghei]SCM15181.1 phosphatidylinositol-4-phosphate 5-kinase, putative [Plasmodium berghei]SCM16976.1 phosphatidylinositol-4-phosphate 5-kinase, putative [Plasmodium berghei]SCN21796.1 phosphatidylinositol-4-phosphate 5-kinase, putative [Plasmodium berghei]|eukprot:XP_034419757.1 phosphatidylinositol-4-phosphate 5-kinase, putative [Plasmodium berghei ANKA]